MTTLVMLRVKGDVAKLEARAAANPAGMKAIAEKAQGYGLIRHRFFGTADEIIVVDEWKDEDSFRRFFEASPEITQMMGEVGVTTEPQFVFARELDTDDAFG
jgi:heme-degrading monooxygenase HmoA